MVFVRRHGQIGAKMPKITKMKIQNFFKAIFEVEVITHPDEPRVPRRAPNFQFSYGIEKTGLRAYYTAFFWPKVKDAKND